MKAKKHAVGWNSAMNDFCIYNEMFTKWRVKVMGYPLNTFTSTKL